MLNFGVIPEQTLCHIGKCIHAEYIFDDTRGTLVCIGCSKRGHKLIGCEYYEPKREEDSMVNPEPVPQQALSKLYPPLGYIITVGITKSAVRLRTSAIQHRRDEEGKVQLVVRFVEMRNLFGFRQADDPLLARDIIEYINKRNELGQLYGITIMRDLKQEEETALLEGYVRAAAAMNVVPVYTMWETPDPGLLLTKAVELALPNWAKQAKIITLEEGKK